MVVISATQSEHGTSFLLSPETVYSNFYNIVVVSCNRAIKPIVECLRQFKFFTFNFNLIG